MAFFEKYTSILPTNRRHLSSRYSASRLGAHIPQFLPIIITHASSEDADDELREICFQSLESFVIRCPTEITPFVDQIIELALTYLKYDPNYAADDNEVGLFGHFVGMML